MILLYGTPVSNYYNTVLAALQYKNIEFQEVHMGAADDQQILLKSPMGKIPFIKHDDQYLSETSVILEYLEELYPEPALYGATHWQRARIRQLIKFIELYIDAPARRLFPGVFWSLNNDRLHVEEVRPIIERGLQAVDGLTKDTDFLLGDSISAADLFGYFAFDIAAKVTVKQYGWNFMRNRPALQRSMKNTMKLPFMKHVVDQHKMTMKAYLIKKAEAARQIERG